MNIFRGSKYYTMYTYLNSYNEFEWQISEYDVATGRLYNLLNVDELLCFLHHFKAYHDDYYFYKHKFVISDQPWKIENSILS